MADDVPMDEDGKPMSKVHFHVGEKIGLPNYSNVDLGASITRFVRKEDELKEIQDIAEIVEKKVLAVERQKIIDKVAQQAGS